MQLRQADLTWHVAGDEVVVLDLAGSVYLKLNGTGRVLWEALAAPTSDSALTAILVERYEIDEQGAADDVARFVAELRTRGLLDE
jgi:Coenzyme PQQ synthesis protein D (PqqD)